MISCVVLCNKQCHNCHCYCLSQHGPYCLDYTHCGQVDAKTEKKQGKGKGVDIILKCSAILQPCIT